ncbi:MAG: sodium/proton-translocating pyrophosphatase [Melioribacteraceae bacterium]|nr:sodium/proton-translocating pyrophosphatase [Melioribacteraceae bacterium]
MWNGRFGTSAFCKSWRRYFTKAADVGGDLVGKVEAGIPEDDPRNPATIADNVGDNVGDVAGMGADLYESYCGSILATAALGASAFLRDQSMQFNAVIAPMLVAVVGIVLSVIGIFLVRTKEDATQKDLLSALSRSINISSVLIVIFSLGIIHFLELKNPWGVWARLLPVWLLELLSEKAPSIILRHRSNRQNQSLKVHRPVLQQLLFPGWEPV